MSSNYVRKRQAGCKENAAPQQPPQNPVSKVYEPVLKSVRMKTMLEKHVVGKSQLPPQQRRAFGTVVQVQLKTTCKELITTGKLARKPNLNDRLWNPSPSKKLKTRELELGKNVDENNFHHQRGKYWRELDVSQNGVYAGGSKSGKASTYDENRSYVIPYNDKDPVVATLTNGDLNNSFTEKISNLDLGNLLNTSLSGSSSTTPSPLLLTSPSPRGLSSSGERESNNSPQKEADKKWVESLDPDYPYITEILNYWHELELTHKTNPNYMSKQKEISYKMRTILVDWLVEVVEEYRIAEATLHRCVHFVDRFLSKLQISRGNLQLLGTTCLFIACKVEEIQPPDTGDLVYITDNTYDKGQLLKMECLVLSVLDFDLLTPTAHEFAEYFSSTLQLSATAKDFTRYITDLTLLDGEKFLPFHASVLGMAACYVAIRCCDHDNFLPTRRFIGDHHNADDPQQNHGGTLTTVLSRVKRLNANVEFERMVEQATGPIYVTLLSTRNNSNGPEQQQTPNSVCNKYKQFQEASFLVSVASSAACSTLPWF